MMRMLRHYFISDNLDDLELFEQQLEDAGFSSAQIHVLSKHDDEVSHHEHLNNVTSLMKKDVLRSTERGALIGVIVAGLSLILAYVAGWTESAAGWVPFIFLAIVLLGFCTWEGGLLGIQKPNVNFAQFDDALKNNKHVFFVDLKASQETALKKVLGSHPQVELAGTGTATPHWLLVFQDRVPHFFRTTFP